MYDATPSAEPPLPRGHPGPQASSHYSGPEPPRRYSAYSGPMSEANPRSNASAANFSQVPHQEDFPNYGSASTAGYRRTYTIPRAAPDPPRRTDARQSPQNPSSRPPPPRTPAPPPPAPVWNWELDLTRSELGLAYYVDKYNGRQLVEFYSDPDRFSFSPSETRAGDIIDYVGEPDDILVLVGRRTGLKYSLIPFGPRWSVIISFNRRLYDIVNLKWFDRRNKAIRLGGKRPRDVVIDKLDMLMPFY
ncbi:hypothetical protein DFH11DRAFT_1604822 [Phellopilus nigrolimitatus]|nr:hypothetical protein DFH11DRAFT_1604822 [Phellopilus nigrolimitatus]